MPRRLTSSDPAPHHSPGGSEQLATSYWDIASIQYKSRPHRVHKQYRTSELLTWFPIISRISKKLVVHQADAWRLYPVRRCSLPVPPTDWISIQQQRDPLQHPTPRPKGKSSTAHFSYLLFELREDETSWLPISEGRPPELLSSPLRRPCTTQAACRPLTTLRRHCPLYSQLVSWWFPYFSPNHSGHVRDSHNIVGRSRCSAPKRSHIRFLSNLSIAFSAKRHFDAHGGIPDHLSYKKTHDVRHSTSRQTVIPAPGNNSSHMLCVVLMS